MGPTHAVNFETGVSRAAESAAARCGSARFAGGGRTSVMAVEVPALRRGVAKRCAPTGLRGLRDGPGCGTGKGKLSRLRQCRSPDRAGCERVCRVQTTAEGLCRDRRCRPSSGCLETTDPEVEVRPKSRIGQVAGRHVIGLFESTIVARPYRRPGTYPTAMEPLAEPAVLSGWGSGRACGTASGDPHLACAASAAA